MALIPLYITEVSSDNKTISFIEKTGTYGSSNLGGWGAPNQTVGDVVSSSLVISNVTNNDSPTVYDAINITPSAVYGNITLIETTDLLLSSVSIGDIELADGLYSFAWNIDDGSDVHEVTTLELLLPTICCKLTKLASLYASYSCNNCNTNPYEDLLIKASLERDALLSSFICLDNVTIERKINYLNKLLLKVECSNCVNC